MQKALDSIKLVFGPRLQQSKAKENLSKAIEKLDICEDVKSGS